ncbi:orotidine-5'-phosphate decarboxylase [Corynebacterium tapiri]|uniref:Orotidine-5'-phosphate decarboxylase n=1 Tax=Corynebacterium tapiri TaxID=1448266 RepID=A0A5C4U590_9CORY|nr:orotidine-5'-phosphate decarboxylase [Corynebacterium tapiri]TNL97786.1 orotidine-5'-phosphate decarboxylase [Corynebacterium tapiri]
MTTENFQSRLNRAVSQHGRLCVGIDPHESLLKAWGLEYNARGVGEFSRRCVEAFAGHAALVKPQVAFYERFGSQGIAELEKTLADLRDAGTLTLSDAKRGDIGSTMAGYAQAWLDDSSPLRADSVTISPYLGVGACEPVFKAAADNSAGVFLLAATSNSEAPAIQRATTAEGSSLAQHIVDECGRRNAEGTSGTLGVVVGATVIHPPVLDDLGGPVLMPGVGAQGATAQDVERIAGKALALPNVSRAILSAGPNVADLRERLKEVAGEYPAHLG